MIDFEVKIFNRVHAKVASLCANKKFVSTAIVDEPTAFPAASLIEMSNTTVERLQSSTPRENFARLMYQLDVYAMSKADCKKVVAVADDAMIAMNFTRTGGDYINSLGNLKVFRYTARYTATVDRDGNLYRG